MRNYYNRFNYSEFRSYIYISKQVHKAYSNWFEKYSKYVSNLVDTIKIRYNIEDLRVPLAMRWYTENYINNFMYTPGNVEDTYKIMGKFVTLAFKNKLNFNFLPSVEVEKYEVLDNFISDLLDYDVPFTVFKNEDYYIVIPKQSSWFINY